MIVPLLYAATPFYSHPKVTAKLLIQYNVTKCAFKSKTEQHVHIWTLPKHKIINIGWDFYRCRTVHTKKAKSPISGRHRGVAWSE